MKDRRFTDFAGAFRLRLFFAIIISLGVSALVDGVIWFGCIRKGFLVVERQLMNAEAFGVPGEDRNHIGGLIKSSLTVSGGRYLVQWELTLSLIIIGMLVTLGVFMLITRPMRHSLYKVAESVHKMNAGDGPVSIELGRSDCFYDLSQGINSIAGEVYSTRSAAREAETSKNELITNIAHDLRTPLTSIIGYMDIIERNESLDDEKKKEYLKVASQKAKKLSSMIEELFSFTKVEYGQMPLNKMNIDVVQMLRQEMEELYPVFDEKGLHCEFQTDTESFISEVDPEMLIRVFDNLFSNAVKYGSEGKKIDVKVESSSNEIKVHIINYGSVIPEKDIPFLFDKFYKVDSSRNGSAESTGLGLSIAKSIVVNHGGDISVSSSLEGTDFTVTLPRSSN